MSSFKYYDPSLNYENLEVLGDSLLKAIISIYLYDTYKEDDEKFLTKKRMKLINNKFLSLKAFQCNI